MGRNFREMFERVRITKLMNLAKSRRFESLSQIAESWAVSRGALTKQTTSSKYTSFSIHSKEKGVNNLRFKKMFWKRIKHLYVSF